MIMESDARLIDVGYQLGSAEPATSVAPFNVGWEWRRGIFDGACAVAKTKPRRLHCDGLAAISEVRM